MKKQVIAMLAISGAMPVFSQSTVVINGIMDAGVRVDGGGTAGNIKSVGSGQMAASRMSFSGIEDLGSGLKAAFVLETGIDLDTGAGSSNPPGTATGPFTFGRTAAVALGSDSMGYLSLGRQYTPLWAASAGPANDPFGASWLGGIATLYSTTVRASNSVVYSYGYTARTMLLPAPRVGLGVAAMWSMSEAGSPAPDKSGEQLGFNVSYGDGNWWVGYAYHQVKGSNTFINATALVTDTPKVKQQTLGASYEAGFARFHIGLNRGQNDATGAAKLDRANWHVGVVVPLPGTQSVRAIYGKADDRTVANKDFNNLQIGYQYDLSKRTMLYATYAVVDNNNNSQVTPRASLGTYLNGSTPRSVAVGVRHNF